MAELSLSVTATKIAHHCFDSADDSSTENETVVLQEGPSFQNSIPSSTTSAANKCVCEVCGRVFASSHGLRHHSVSQHSGEMPFSCPTCGQSFKRQETLKGHLSRPVLCQRFLAYERVELPNRPVDSRLSSLTPLVEQGFNKKCPYFRACSLSFTSRTKLVEHIKACHQKTCQRCGVVMASSQMKWHKCPGSIQPKFAASITHDELNKSNDPSTLEGVEVSIVDGQPIKCHFFRFCYMSFATISEMNQHILEVHKKTCTHCNACMPASRFPYHKCQLNTTISDTASPTTSPTKVASDGATAEPNTSSRNKSTLKLFPCRYCLVAFSTNEEVKSHIQTDHRKSCRKFGNTFQTSRFKGHPCVPSTPDISNAIAPPAPVLQVQKKHSSVGWEPLPPFRCIVCQKSHDSILQLMRHHKVEAKHQVTDDARCEFCRRSFKLASLSRHLLNCKTIFVKPFEFKKPQNQPIVAAVRTTSKRKEGFVKMVSCPKCQAKLPVRLLNRHVSNCQKSTRALPPSNSDKLQCGICQSVFDSMASLKSHYLCHDKECPRCHCQLGTNKQQHMESCDGTAPTYPCSTCGLKYVTKSAEIAHRQRIHNPKNRFCGKCGKVFAYARMAAHRLTCNGRSGMKQVALQQQEQLLQPLSERRVIKRRKKRRISTAAGPDSCPCTDCGQIFLNDSSLKTHRMRFHHPVKMFCSRCQRMYDKDVIDQHKATCPTAQSGSTPREVAYTRSKMVINKMHLSKFNCDDCEQRFLNDSSLRTHRKRFHHPSRTFCSRCQKMYDRDEIADHKATCRPVQSTSSDVASTSGYFSQQKLNLSGQSNVTNKSKHAPSINCEDCDQVFLNLTSLRTHRIRRHHLTKSYCSRCQRMFDKSVFATHRTICLTSRGRSKLDIVKVTPPVVVPSAKRKKMTAPSRFAASIGLPNISMVPKDVRGATVAALSSATPSPSKSYSNSSTSKVCVRCHRLFNDFVAYQIHIKLCGKTEERPNSALEEKRKVSFAVPSSAKTSDVNEIRCPYCNEKTTSKNGLRSHIWRNHKPKS